MARQDRQHEGARTHVDDHTPIFLDMRRLLLFTEEREQGDSGLLVHLLRDLLLDQFGVGRLVDVEVVAEHARKRGGRDQFLCGPSRARRVSYGLKHQGTGWSTSKGYQRFEDGDAPCTFQTKLSRILNVSTSRSIWTGTRAPLRSACSSNWSSVLCNERTDRSRRHTRQCLCRQERRGWGGGGRTCPATYNARCLVVLTG